MNAPKPRLLSLKIENKAALYKAYMPFIRNGALFIPTDTAYALGEEVFILIMLPDSKERLPIAGKVVWVTAKGGHGSRSAGIGLQFNEQDKNATRNLIETLLAGMLNSNRSTNTM